MSSVNSDPPASEVEWKAVLKREMTFLLLIAAHLPFLLSYYRGLWSREHYQFFPFALVFFVVLLKQRQSREKMNWTVTSGVLLAVDLLLLLAGTALPSPSPWLVVVGVCFGLAAWCLAATDTGYRRSLLYLMLLPILTVRLPSLYDLELINWLQSVTTTVASRILLHLQYFHYQTGNTLHFPGKDFLV
ncbi:MAG: archaeosortase/exosortase family protein, partial [Planctomycetaceae bacterium]|nr:archaeosortase/exosortase family protein [Planctomycetaceae bacterium]